MSKKNEYPVFTKTKPSETFEGIVCRASTPVNDCEHCGRVNFDAGGESMEDNELADLLKKQEASPKKYIGQGDRIYWGYLAGKQTVIGCPCNALAFYEDIFWRDRFSICEYLEERSKKTLDAAKKSRAAATKAKKAVKNARAR